MQAFEQSIYPELAEFGGIRRLIGVLDETSYEVGGMVMETPGGWRYNATLTNTGEAVLLQGTLGTLALTALMVERSMGTSASLAMAKR